MNRVDVDCSQGKAGEGLTKVLKMSAEEEAAHAADQEQFSKQLEAEQAVKAVQADAIAKVIEADPELSARLAEVEK